MTAGVTAGRLVLHVGLPKAASSALQVWCDANRARLLAEGVDYPDPRSDHLARKHGRLVPELREGRADTLAADVSASRSPVVLVSNEGFAGQYPGFPPWAGAALRAAAGGRRVTLFAISREPGPWLRSLWAQAVLNPVPRGQRPLTEDFDRFAARPAVLRMLDLPARAAEMGAIAGADDVVTATAEGDWFGALLSLVGVARRPGDAPPRAHIAAPAHVIELVRRTMARSGSHPAPVRMALLAAIADRVPGGNVTIANTARAYATRPPPQQARAAGLLVRALAEIEPDGGEMAALHAGVLEWAAARAMR